MRLWLMSYDFPLLRFQISRLIWFMFVSVILYSMADRLTFLLPIFFHKRCNFMCRSSISRYLTFIQIGFNSMYTFKFPLLLLCLFRFPTYRLNLFSLFFVMFVVPFLRSFCFYPSMSFFPWPIAYSFITRALFGERFALCCCFDHEWILFLDFKVAQIRDNVS